MSLLYVPLCHSSLVTQSTAQWPQQLLCCSSLQNTCGMWFHGPETLLWKIQGNENKLAIAPGPVPSPWPEESLEFTLVLESWCRSGMGVTITS